ncbi:putative pantothenate transporter liz1 protein [Echria macrotheca]|uniref:Pantothenate transporter liz1 protein n=1 Tax=Echria macrotheca TaxID=438768 RepID=A0AAJ0FEJ7_9PEZI|nr:putative pantothenate transporter liz1 protein [Echria macrotheca]
METLPAASPAPVPAGKPGEQTKVSLLSYIWDKDTHLKSPAERSLVRKLDLSILIIACVGFFMKFLDQTNIMNAYVSGMKEDLAMNGNEYTYAQTAYTVGYAVMQVPSTLIVQKVPPRIWLALAEVGWGVFTFAQAGLRSNAQLYAFRFLVGLFESSFSPVMIYVMGSWYTRAELAKRITIFQASAVFGTTFSGYLQAAVYNGLDGAHGIAGWRWLYIVCGCMTVPVGIATYFVFPDQPWKTTAWFLTDDDKALAMQRVRAQGIAEPTRLTWATAKRILTRWRWYAFVLGYILYGCSSLAGSFFGIWLISEGFSVTNANVIPTGTWLISGFLTLLWGFLSDLTGSRFLFVLIPLVLGVIPNAILAAWPPGVGIKEFAFLTVGVQLMPGVFFAWASETCRDDNEERAVISASMNGLSYAILAWLPILIFPQTMAPDFRYGFPTSLGLLVGAIFVVIGLQFLVLRQNKLKVARAGSVEDGNSSDGKPVSGDGKVATTDVKTVLD